MTDLYINWKDTDLCGNFRCECGSEFHIDAYFVFAVECSACGVIWKTPGTVELEKVEGARPDCTHSTKNDILLRDADD